jgi:Protein of unknown function (DUF3761)
MRRLIFSTGVASLVLIVAALAMPITAGADSPPAGATAQCTDGTYSYSTTRSGTCSHHGGVATWLTGGTTTTETAPAQTTVVTSTPSQTTETTTVPTTSSGSVDIGHTVMLAARTRTSGCTLGANPDRRCSPGAYYTGLTKAVLCSPTFHTSTVRNVPDSEKHQVEVEYGLVPRGYDGTLELGGSNDVANLFPEKAAAHPGYRAKDKLENKLHAMVCGGQIALRTTQRSIASNWQALYKQVYGTAPIG